MLLQQRSVGLQEDGRIGIAPLRLDGEQRVRGVPGRHGAAFDPRDRSGLRLSGGAGRDGLQIVGWGTGRRRRRRLLGGRQRFEGGITLARGRSGRLLGTGRGGHGVGWSRLLAHRDLVSHHLRLGGVAGLAERREVDHQIVAIQPDRMLGGDDVLELELGDGAAVDALDGRDPHPLHLRRADGDGVGHTLNAHVQKLQDEGLGVGLIGGVAERIVPVQYDLRARRRRRVVDAVNDHCGRRGERRLTRLADGRVARATQGGRGDGNQDRDLPEPHKLPSSVAVVSLFVTSR